MRIALFSHTFVKSASLSLLFFVYFSFPPSHLFIFYPPQFLSISHLSKGTITWCFKLRILRCLSMKPWGSCEWARLLAMLTALLLLLAVLLVVLLLLPSRRRRLPQGALLPPPPLLVCRPLR